ncbi:MAG: amino acid adenylation domain-containing protein [Cytophagales bacterium]|nr:amino acid adenylation domain-containing protein [Cytophagales bacterium]
MWTDRLMNLTGMTSLWSSFSASNSNSGSDCDERISISADTRKDLVKMSKNNPTSALIIHICAFSLTYYKYTLKTEICLNVPLNVEENTSSYILSFQVDPSESISALLRRVATAYRQLLEDAVFPIDPVYDKIAAMRPESFKNLFKFGIHYEPLHGSFIRNRQIDSEIVIDNDIRAWFNPVGILQDLLPGFLQHYCHVLSLCLADPKMPCGHVQLMNVQQREHLKRFNHLSYGIETFPLITDMFSRNAQNIPHALSIVCEERTYTYEQLSQAINRLANYLVEKHAVTKGARVGTLYARSERNVIAMMAIMKTGAIYVPVDYKLPVARIDLILQNSKPVVIIAEGRMFATNHAIADRCINIDELDLEQYSTSFTTPSVEPGDGAYIVFTSGSTGVPKAIIQTHRTLSNLVIWQHNVLKIQSGLSFLQYASFNFDVSLQDVAFILSYAGCLHITTEDVRFEFQKMAGYVVDKKIDALFFPFSVLSNFFSTITPNALNGHSLKHIFTGSEQVLIGDSLEQFLRANNDVQLHNQYGPSETHVVTNRSLSGNTEIIKRVPIGIPIANTSIYILDANRDLVPEGVTGEVFIGGANLALRYEGLEKETSERFITINIAGVEERVYKSGDIARWLPTGELEYLGRIDNQVKIRGYRIELGEIEKVILRHSDIKEAVVIVMPNPSGDSTLISFYLGTSDDENGLKEFLHKTLPEYMVPTRIMRLDSFPLNQNGKLDKTKLPDPFEQVNTELFTPADTLESIILSAWEENLKVRSVSIEDDYFMQGGDSLKAIRLVVAINKVAKVEVGVKDLYEFSKFGAFATHVKSTKTLKYGEQRRIQSELLESWKQQMLPSITHLDWEDVFPMTDIQRGMIYHYMLSGEACIYHDQNYTSFMDADFDISSFKQAFGLMVMKHPVLRTSFDFNTLDREIQIVHLWRSSIVNFSEQDISHLSNDEQFAFLTNYLEHDRILSFKFETPGLYRLILFKQSPELFTFLWSVHHSIMDGWSYASFLTDLNNVYLNVKKGKGDIETIGLTVKDHYLDQQIAINDIEAKEYWSQVVTGKSPAVLPFNRQVKEEFAQSRYASKLRSIPKELQRDLDRVARNYGIGQKELFLAATAALIQLTTGQRSAGLGLVTNTRPELDQADMVLGCFLNTIPFFTDVQTGSQLDMLWVKKVRDQYYQLKQFDKYPLSEILRLAGPQYVGQTSLFYFLFDFVDFHIYEKAERNIQVNNNMIAQHEQSNAILQFQFNKTGDHVDLSVNYVNTAYESDEIDQVLSYFFKILEAWARDQAVSGMSLVNNDSLLCSDKAFVVGEPLEDTIVSTFTRIAKQYPDAVAISDPLNSWTYEELDRYSKAVASFLVAKIGVTSEKLIGLMAPRNATTIVGILGILKAGCAYVPIDPEYPQSRVDYICKDATIDVMISPQSSGENVPVNIRYFSIESMMSFDPANVSVTINNTQLAYIIYTSGSTGAPKGVMIEHRNVIGLIQRNLPLFNFGPDDTWTLMHSFCFDFSVWELFGPLLTGGKVIVLPKDQLHVRDVSALINEANVTVINIVPSVFQNIFSGNEHEFPSVRHIIFGGEALNPALLASMTQAFPKTRFINMYGITETCVHVSFRNITREDMMSTVSNIGGDLLNSHMYLLSEHGEPVPDGVEGEIGVTGEGVARGYLNNEQLTRQRFIANPWIPGQRIYLSGDIAVVNGNNDIIYKGRRDKQVKIRGHRIELEEILHHISVYPGIDNAFVGVRKVSGDDAIIAYFKSSSVKDEDLRLALGSTLPSYMVPSYFVKMNSFPQTFNGKLDIDALPAPDTMTLDKDDEVASDLERSLMEIFEEVLGREVNVTSDFFREGGHSLSAIRLIGFIDKKFNVKIEIRELFGNPSPRQLSSMIAAREAAVIPVSRVTHIEI